MIGGLDRGLRSSCVPALLILLLAVVTRAPYALGGSTDLWSEYNDEGWKTLHAASRPCKDEACLASYERAEELLLAALDEAVDLAPDLTVTPESGIARHPILFTLRRLDSLYDRWPRRLGETWEWPGKLREEKFAEVKLVYARIGAYIQQSWGDDSEPMVEFLASQGSTYAVYGHREEALSIFQLRLKTAERVYARIPWMLYSAHRSLSRLCADISDLECAEEHGLRVIGLAEQASKWDLGFQQLSFVDRDFHHLGLTYERMGDPERAEMMWRGAIKIDDRDLPGNRIWTYRVHLACAYEAQGEIEQGKSVRDEIPEDAGTDHLRDYPCENLELLHSQWFF